MIHIGDLDGKAKSTKRGWRATMKIKVVDENGDNVSKANVSGTWTEGTFSCKTNRKGICKVRTGNISNELSEVEFNIEDITHSSMKYDDDANTDPDDDSDGTEIEIPNPVQPSSDDDDGEDDDKDD